MKLLNDNREVLFDSPEEWIAYGAYLDLIGEQHCISKELAYKSDITQTKSINIPIHVQYLKEFDKLYNNHD